MMQITKPEKKVLSYLANKSKKTVQDIQNGISRDQQKGTQYSAIHKACKGLVEKKLVKFIPGIDQETNRVQKLFELTELGLAHALVLDSSLRVRKVFQKFSHFKGFKLIDQCLECIENIYGEKFNASFAKTALKAYIFIFEVGVTEENIWVVMGAAMQGWILKERSRLNPKKIRQLERCLERHKKGLGELVNKQHKIASVST